jgi:patatin-like phospholipase/acyl hydrolase
MKKTINVLEIDGGGIKSVSVLIQLRDFEKMVKTPLKDYFDLIAGTSTGAIIATLLSIGYTTDAILDLYVIHGEGIFHKDFFRWGIFRPKYDDTYFNHIIKEYTKELTLKDCQANILIPTYNATKKQGEIFKSSKAKLGDSENYKLFDVIRSSASAPTYFKATEINGDRYVDGGLYVNNPSLMAFIESVKDGYNKIDILSFSTGCIEEPITKGAANGGIATMASPTMNIVLTEATQTTDYLLKQLYAILPNLNGGNRFGIYVRCNSIIKKSSGKIDDASKENIQNLISDGETSAKINKDKMKYFFYNTLR